MANGYGKKEVTGRRSATKETLVPRSGLKKVAIDIVKANIFAIVIMVVAAIVFLVPFFWIWADKKPVRELLGDIGDWSTAFILMFVGIVFVIKAYDGKGMLEKRMEVRPRHLDGSHQWNGCSDQIIAIENKQEHKHEDSHSHYLRREFSYSNYGTACYCLLIMNLGTFFIR